MNKIIISLVNRFKKLAILLLLLPVLTGAISYFIESREPTKYIATSEILLGTFQNNGLTDKDLMKEQVPTRAFLRVIDEKYNLGMDVEFVSNHLKVDLLPGKILAFSLASNNESEVEEQLSLVIEGFLLESENVQQNSIKLIEEKLRTIQSINPSDKEVIAKEQFIYSLESKLFDLRLGTELNKPVTITVDSNDSIKMGLLGGIVGLMLSLSILVFPEIFRE
jgi:hypothetical protein